MLWIKECVLYICGAVIVALLITNGVTLVANTVLKKELAVKAETIKTKDAQLSQRDALIEEMGVRTQQVLKKVDVANRKVSSLQEERKRLLTRIENTNFPSDCRGAVDTTIELIPEILLNYRREP